MFEENDNNLPTHKIGELNRKKVIDSYVQKKEEEQVQEEKGFHQIVVEKTMEEMLSKDNIEMKTDLKNEMILELSRADVILGVFTLPALKTFTESVKVLSVSKDRQGRGELVSLTNNGNMMNNEIDPSSKFRNIIDRLT